MSFTGKSGRLAEDQSQTSSASREVGHVGNCHVRDPDAGHICAQQNSQLSPTSKPNPEVSVHDVANCLDTSATHTATKPTWYALSSALVGGYPRVFESVWHRLHRGGMMCLSHITTTTTNAIHSMQPMPCNAMDSLTALQYCKKALQVLETRQ